ncbi:MAG TPA: BatD family protein [Candidatus Acidoferrum sp.]|jgi:hypothetical protein|nr:BatD family protein [Candidatus Acidoferrum sp.]
MRKLRFHAEGLSLRCRWSWSWLWFALALPVFLCPAGLLAATFTASLDRDTLTLGETATLSLAFVGGTPRSVPTPPNIPNLQIAYLGPSSQFSVINGEVSSSVTYNFQVTPQRPGDYTIPAVSAEVGSERFASQPLLLKVLQPTAPSAQAINSGSQLAFLKLLLPKNEFYVGESFTLQVQLYVANQVRRIGGFQLTGFTADGFVLGKSARGQDRQTQVGNTAYTIISFIFPITAIKAGSMTLGPVTANVVLGGRDAFDPFGVFGGGSDQRQLSLATDAEPVRSLPLPRENAPASFNGAVGVYTMTVTAGPTNLTVGDPVTVKVQISGRGSLDGLTLPEQPEWRDFKTYPPTTKVETTDQLGLQGTKTFEQVVQPENADIKALPPMSFSFFDPDQKTYRTLTQPAVQLLVRPGGSTPTPTVLAGARTTQDNTPPTQDIVPNKQRLGTLARIGPPLAQQTWFLALQGVPVLAFLSMVVWRRRTEALANNPRLRRRRQVAQNVRDGLQDLKQAATEKKSDQFFVTVFRLLQEQLGERLDVPASAITEAVIEERLRPRAVAETTLTGLQDLFQMCNLARYAPIKTSQELAAIIPKFEAVLHKLEELEL